MTPASQDAPVVEVEAGGSRYDLRYTVNTLCELEALISRKISALLSDIVAGEVSMTDLRATFWAGLQDRHPGIGVQAAGDIITEIGIETAASAIATGFLQVFPAPVTLNTDPMDD